MEGQGLIHYYCGDGKGKTSAAVGLAVRAAGAGLRVLFVQFFKDGASGELQVLRRLPGVEVLTLPAAAGFSWTLDEAQKAALTRAHNALLAQAVERADSLDLLVLDELGGALSEGFADRAAVLDFLRRRPPALEVAVTGHRPDEALAALSDYYSYIEKRRHPFDRGVKARRGIEF